MFPLLSWLSVCSSVKFFGFSVDIFGVAQKVCFCAFWVPDHRQICLLVCRVFFCGISALLPPEKGMKGHIHRTAAPSSRKRLRSYHHRRLDFYGVLSMLPVHHLPALISSYLGEKKRFLLSKLNAITCLTITSKWSVAMMEIFLSLKKYPALCELKSLGAS